MIQIYSSELFLREKGKNCVNSDQYTEYFEDIWGSKVGSIEIPGIYNTCLNPRKGTQRFRFLYRVIALRRRESLQSHKWFPLVQTLL